MEFTSDLDLGGSLTLRGADDDGTASNADVELTDTYGERWSATVMTLAEVARLMGTWEATGECQSGAYFRVPDLVIVRDPRREAVVEVFAELHRTGDHRHEMSRLLDE